MEGKARLVVFVVGSPRSGTSWLQKVLGAHPEIVTPQETDLFSAFVVKLQRTWEGQRENSARRRYRGLPALMTNAEFEVALGRFVEEVLSRAYELKPGATVLVEKTPSHSLHVESIARLVKGARFVHMLRDGRDVAASVNAASKHAFASEWAPPDVGGAAEIWRRHVNGAMGARSLAPYLETRYEELVQSGAAEWKRLFEFCGVEADEAFVEEALGEAGAATSAGMGSIVFGGEMGRPAKEADGFYGAGRVGAWRAMWTPRDRWEFDRRAGDLLVELGYESDRSWARAGPLETSFYAGAAAARELRDKALRHAGGWLRDAGMRSAQPW
jgi:Sulfotransferase family